jgi:hypothetical protein
MTKCQEKEGKIVWVFIVKKNESTALWNIAEMNFFAAREAVRTGILWGISVRYHSGGSMKLNACVLLLSHMVYLWPKHILLLVAFTRLLWYTYIDYNAKFMAQSLVIPLAGFSLPIPPFPQIPLTYLESLLLCGKIPSTLVPGCSWTGIPLPIPSPFQFPGVSPNQLRTLLRRHHDLGFT